jgi:FkbM family methyltransferase
LACYKIDYPSVPNGLFPHIDEAEQARRFVDQVVDAYNNNYMYQQKQQYCSVVDDIYGWDTIALQWKQHFYTALFMPLPVEEYREATRITQKVNRVFGRRYNNTEDRNTYKSFGKQRSIVVVSPFWNASDYIESCIMSVAQQDYDEYMHILIDDASTDDSAVIVEDVLSKFSPEFREKFIFIRNDENKGAIRNQLEAIEKFAVDTDIVMLLDGDDCLMPNNTIFHYYSDLYQNGYEFTYGSMWSLVDNIQLVAQEYPDHVKQNKTYRTHMFNWKIPYTHLRTTLGKYFKNLDNSKFKDTSGNWMKAGADNPLFYELIEQVEPEKIYCNKEIVHLYNDLNPLNDYKIRGEEQNRNAAMSFEQPLKDESVKETVKTILIAVPTNKYIEPETMKSIYDLIIPEGYQTRFEFFYGYQIDQIRNLIADWAKNYDYLLSVDSDIVLPNDTLVKMIAADKDIITGLYIQRNPNQHILEVYQDRAGGGVENIPYWAIKDLGTIPVSACGFGCVLVKGEVFRSMEYPHFAYTSAIDHANTISEDIYFCNKARGLGFAIWCDTTIHCNHIGSTKFVVSQEKSTGLLLTDKMKVIPKTEKKTNLAKTYETDLLPVEHVNYLYSMKVSPKVIYDIGACLCHWQRHAKLAFPESKIILFDAEPEVEPYLSMSGCEHHIGVLTNEDEKPIKFYHDANNPGGNSYYKENSDFFTEEHVMNTTGMTLDTIVELRGFPLPDMIKLDIQGAEIDVLRGATKTLANVTDIILEAQHVNYNEGAPNVGDVIMFMNSIGFRLVSNFCMHDVDGDYHFTRKS